jgi:formate/nitrite transporter
MLGAALFPVGLIGILLTGAELFTSDSLFMVASFLGGKIHYYHVVRNVTVSWIMNFVGALFWSGFLTYFAGQLEFVEQVDFAVEFAEHKADQAWHRIFLKEIGANFLICLAVWQFTTAGTVAGKILGIWFPVTTFVICGFDHCIANMYFLPVGMYYGADITIVQLLFLLLLPATLGNMIGGGIGMGGVYWYLYDSMASRANLDSKVREALTFHPTVKHHDVDKNSSALPWRLRAGNLPGTEEDEDPSRALSS